MNHLTSYGLNLRLSVWGGSHDPEIGVRLEGFPAGVSLKKNDLLRFMERRAPGRNRFSTTRKEDDVPVFLCGVTEEDDVYTTNGECLEAVIRNKAMRSRDYRSLVEVPRPSHADFAARMKYGKDVDLRGGGHFSGRLTAPICIAGAFCLAFLQTKGISIGAHLYAVGDVMDEPFDETSPDPALFASVAAKEFPTVSDEAGEAMRQTIERARMDGDSVGGIIECAAVGVPVGLGEHMFHGMEGRIASLVFSIPAVKGVEFGRGFGSSRLRGSENNDAFVTDGRTVRTKTNRCGGILGGMTDGMPLLFRAAMKPTPSISREQESVNLSTMENVKLVIEGRHDPCVAPRAVPVMEAALAIALTDAMLDDGGTEASSTAGKAKSRQKNL